MHQIRFLASVRSSFRPSVCVVDGVWQLYTDLQTDRLRPWQGRQSQPTGLALVGRRGRASVCPSWAGVSAVPTPPSPLWASPRSLPVRASSWKGDTARPSRRARSLPPPPNSGEHHTQCWLLSSGRPKFGFGVVAECAKLCTFGQYSASVKCENYSSAIFCHHIRFWPKTIQRRYTFINTIGVACTGQ